MDTPLTAKSAVAKMWYIGWNLIKTISLETKHYEGKEFCNFLSHYASCV